MWTQSVVFVVVILLGVVSCFPSVPGGRIVNGIDSDIEKFPFMVSLRYSDGTHGCGGSVITPSWILTAAHCVKGLKPNQLYIMYGESTLKYWSQNTKGIKRIIYHKDYDQWNAFKNDIALIELLDPLEYDYKTIAPIALPAPEFEVSQERKGALGTLIGWGFNGTGGSLQEQLQEVDLKIYSDVECHERLWEVTRDHICAGVDEGGKGQCTGDSGGPLMYLNEDNIPVQLGIVSWSVKPCTLYPYPGVFTKVSHYIDWIKENMS